MRRLIRSGTTVVVFTLLPAVCYGVAQAQRTNSPGEFRGGSYTGVARERSFEQRNAIKTESLLPFNTSQMNQQLGLSEYFRGLDFIHRRHPRYGDAEKAFKSALLLAPTLTEASSGLAYVYTATGRYAEAEEIYKSLLRRSPASAENLFNLGAVYFYRGDKDLARAQVEILIKLKSKLAQRLKNLIETR